MYLIILQNVGADGGLSLGLALKHTLMYSYQIDLLFHRDAVIAFHQRVDLATAYFVQYANGMYVCICVLFTLYTAALL